MSTAIPLPRQAPLDSAKTTLAELEIRAIVARHGDFPAAVAHAPISQLTDRILCPAHFDDLTTQAKMAGSDAAWAKRLYKRKVRLKRFVGRRLVCAFIRLPGAHCTIEIDPETKTVVHWESQII